MQFAPDGRLFVAEQGGRLRVIKDGVLLPTPFLTLTVSSVGRARAARRRLRSGLRDQPVRVRLLHRHDAGHPQPHQPLHRQRRRRGRRQRGGAARAEQSQRRDEPQRRRARVRRRRQAVRGRRARTPTAPTRSRSTTCSARCCGSTPTARSRPTTRSSAPTTGNNRAIWALGLRNPFTFAFHPTRDTMFINDVGQNTWEEINDGVAGANYGWPETEGATQRSAVSCRPRYAYNHSPAAPCAITGGAFYAPPTVQFPADYVERLLLRRLLRRLDQRSSIRQRQRRGAPSPPASRRPSISRSAATAACTTSRADRRRRRVYRISYSATRAEHHAAAGQPDRGAGRVGDVQRSRLGPGAAPLSVAAQRRQHLRRHRAGLHVRRRRRRQRRAASAPSSATTPAA